MDLSIVVPLYNEQESVKPLFRAIADVADKIQGQVEIIFVDDGSRDETFSVAKNLACQDKRLRVIKFRKNYGQTPAMAAGIDQATGNVIITMDGDLQNDPADIPTFVEKMDEGFDIVVGWRHNRRDKLISRKIPSRIANWLIGKVTGVPIKDNGCSLKAFRANVIKNVPLYNDMHRFIPAMASIAGPRIAEIKVRHNARQFGESKYGLGRVYKVLFDLLTIKTVSGFSERPLQWFAILATPFLLSSIGILSWQIFGMILGKPGSLPIAGAGVFFGALCMFLLFSGGLAELITRTGDLHSTHLQLLTSSDLTARTTVSESPIQSKEMQP